MNRIIAPAKMALPPSRIVARQKRWLAGNVSLLPAISAVVTMVLLDVMVLGFSASSVEAAPSLKKTWPCIQRKVPELSAATIWDGPELNITDRGWEKNDVIAKLVRSTVSRRRSVAQAKALINKYAAGLTPEQKTALLPQVFTGQFQILNTERRVVMAGIERYSRRQKALSEIVKKENIKNDKLALTKPMTKAVEKRLDALNEKLKWDTRIYDERQQSLRYVCEVPVLLEQRLFALGRHIITLLPGQ